MNWTISASNKVSTTQVSHIISNKKNWTSHVICFKMWNGCSRPMFVLREKKVVGFHILLAHIGDSVSITNWWGAVVSVVFSTFVQMCSKTTLIMSENLWTTCFIRCIRFCSVSIRPCTHSTKSEQKRSKKDEKAQFVFSGWIFSMLFLFLFEAFTTPFANGFHVEIDLSTLFSTVVNLLCIGGGFKSRLNIFIHLRRVHTHRESSILEFPPKIHAHQDAHFTSCSFYLSAHSRACSSVVLNIACTYMLQPAS